MIVNMGDNTYKMSRDQFNTLLETAKKCMPFGVYAIEKRKVAIMLNERPKDKDDLLKQVEEYKSKGFKVYYNG